MKRSDDVEGAQYDVVPKAVAEKINELREDWVFFNKETEAHVEEDDYYADYKIPDDLMW